MCNKMMKQSSVDSMACWSRVECVKGTQTLRFSFAHMQFRHQYLYLALCRLISGIPHKSQHSNMCSTCSESECWVYVLLNWAYRNFNWQVCFWFEAIVSPSSKAFLVLPLSWLTDAEKVSSLIRDAASPAFSGFQKTNETQGSDLRQNLPQPKLGAHYICFLNDDV